MPAIRDLDPTVSPAHFFGAEVRRARATAGMTLADLAVTVPCDASTVSRIEAGEREPTERFAVACDEAFPHMTGWFTRFYRDSRKWLARIRRGFGIGWRPNSGQRKSAGGSPFS
jgi:DNA-binding XRE family transcriptional regulator